MQINVLEYFEQGALKHCPSKVAIIGSDKTYTFRELETYAKKFAALILQRKDIINQPIAVFLPKNANTIIADLGILYSGNFYNNLDVKSPSQRLKNIIDNINPAFIITTSQLLEALKKIGFEGDRIILIDELYEVEIPYNNEMILKRLDSVIDTDPVCLINTSGSTGIPKGVVMHHRSVIDFIDWVNNELGWN